MRSQDRDLRLAGTLAEAGKDTAQCPEEEKQGRSYGHSMNDRRERTRLILFIAWCFGFQPRDRPSI